MEAKADTSRRNAIRRHHLYAIIHEALVRVLGSHVRQAGSYVSRLLALRLLLTLISYREELVEIERIANEIIQMNIKVNVFETTMDKAKEVRRLFEENTRNSSSNTKFQGIVLSFAEVCT